MVRLELDERADALLGPVEALLLRALVSLPDAPPLVVRVASLPALGESAPFSVLRGDTLFLSEELCGPALSHSREPLGPLPAMDRWRRACGCVLEAAAARQISLRISQPVGADWRWVGAAISVADRLAPELAIDLPDLALALTTGSPGEHPRAGAAVMRAWRAFGSEPVARVEALLDGSVISATEWSKIGAWVFAPDGLAALLPVPIERLSESELPLSLPPWSWRTVRAETSPSGSHIAIDSGAVADAWAVGGQPFQTLAASTSVQATVRLAPGAPVGLWTVASAEGFGSVMGARGIQFQFFGDGRLEIILADAFVGPLAAVAMADQVGTSGVCGGRWSIAGDHRLRFLGIETRSLTLHGRTRDRFLMPARGFGLGEWLEALAEDVWDWQLTSPSDPASDRLVMRGRMMGGAVEVRLKRPHLEMSTS